MIIAKFLKQYDMNCIVERKHFVVVYTLYYTINGLKNQHFLFLLDREYH